MGSSHGQQTIQGACVSETAVHDHGRRLNQREFRPMAEVAFRPARQLSEYKGKGASASREVSQRRLTEFILIEQLSDVSSEPKFTIGLNERIN